MALLTNLRNYWELSEASGNRLDSVGGETLTETGTVTSTSGLGGTVAVFDGTSAYLKASSNPFTGISVFSWSGWFYVDSTQSGTRKWLNDTTASTGEGVYAAGRGDGGSMYFATHDGTTLFEKNRPSSGNTWFHFVVTVNGTAVNYYINNSQASIVGGGSVTMAANVDRGASPVFRIGEFNGTYFKGQVAKLGFWTEVLDATQRSALYNSGSPPSYPFGENQRNPVSMGFELS